MKTNFSPKDWKKFRQNYRDLEAFDLELRWQNDGVYYLWDTIEMAVKIKNNMRLTNGDKRFSPFPDPTIYLAGQLKFIKNNDALKLLMDFYLYDECHYDAVLYGDTMINNCNNHSASYIETITRMLYENNDYEEEHFYFVPWQYLCTLGDKMRWAKYDGKNLYYEEPEPKAAVTEEERQELLKLLEELEKNKRLH